MFVSEIYAVWDCIKYDGGTISNHNDIYETLDANTKFDRYDEYSSITEVTSGTNAILKLTVPTSCTIDLELNQVDGTVTDQIINIYSNNTYKTLFNMQNIGTIGNWVKLRLELEEGQITITNLDDTSKTKSNTFTGTANQLRLGTLSTTTEIRIRNVKVHPI